MPARPPPRPRPTPPGPAPRRGRQPPRTPALERLEFLERKEATRRSIQRNASQARGELERGNPEEIIRITGLMLRGKNLRTLVSPQIPLVYYRGRAFEALKRTEEALACFRAVAAWDGGSNQLVNDARPFIDRAVQRLVALHGQPPSGPADIAPQRDLRVFPRPYLTAGRLIGAFVVTFLLLICSAILLATPWF